MLRSPRLSFGVIMLLILVFIVPISSAAAIGIREDEPLDDIELASSYSGGDGYGGTIIFQYPENWEIVYDEPGEGFVVVATSQRAYTNMGIATGEAYLALAGIPHDLLTELGFGAAPNTTEVLELLSTAFVGEGEGFFTNPGPIIEQDFGETHGAMLNANSMAGDAQFILLEREGNFVLMIVNANHGEITLHESIIRAIAESVFYLPTGDF